MSNNNFSLSTKQSSRITAYFRHTKPTQNYVWIWRVFFLGWNWSKNLQTLFYGDFATEINCQILQAGPLKVQKLWPPNSNQDFVWYAPMMSWSFVHLCNVNMAIVKWCSKCTGKSDINSKLNINQQTMAFTTISIRIKISESSVWVLTKKSQPTYSINKCY